MGACLLHRLPQPVAPTPSPPSGIASTGRSSQTVTKRNKGLFLLEMPPPVFRGCIFLLCCRQTFRARPFAVAGAEYTGRGSLLSAGPVSGVLPESGYGCFCTQNSSLCTFFRPWIPFSARKSVSSQHENSKVEMLERIQYALFILLFVLAGSLDGAQVQSGRVVSQPTEFASPLSGRRFRHTIVHAAVFTCDAPIRNPSNRPPEGDRPSRHDAGHGVGRGLSCRPAYSDCFDLHPKPVDYYVFSLGRILI